LEATLSAVARRAKAGATTGHLAKRNGGLRRSLSSGRALRDPVGSNQSYALRAAEVVSLKVSDINSESHRLVGTRRRRRAKSILQ